MNSLKDGLRYESESREEQTVTVFLPMEAIDVNKWGDFTISPKDGSGRWQASLKKLLIQIRIKFFFR